MEMRASQVIKGALGGGAKRKKKDGGRKRERREEEKRGERHLQIHSGVEVWKLKCHSYLVTAVKQVSNIADLTSLGTKVILTFETFCRLHHRFYLETISPFQVKIKTLSPKTDLIMLKKLLCT